MHLLGAILADPGVEIVLHDADFDLRLLDRDFRFRAANLFDTRVAAQLLNEPAIGLAALLSKYLRVQLDKRFQRADWSQRPLSAAMLDYAATDTRHLPALRDILRDKLLQASRLSWAEEEFALLDNIRWAPAGHDEPGFLRMKGAKALPGRTLAALRELFNWREELAKRTDRAPFRIVNNEPLLALARAAPTNLEELAAIPGISRDLVARRGPELLAAIHRALALPESSLPVIQRVSRRAPDSALDARIDRVKAARDDAAVRLGLAPGVLCPKGTLEAVARAQPRDLTELEKVPGVRRWQVEAIGRELLEAVSGQP